MKSRVLKKSDVFREGYVKGLKDAQRVINEMLDGGDSHVQPEGMDTISTQNLPAGEYYIKVYGGDFDEDGNLTELFIELWKEDGDDYLAQDEVEVFNNAGNLELGATSFGHQGTAHDIFELLDLDDETPFPSFLSDWLKKLEKAGSPVCNEFYNPCIYFNVVNA